MTTMTAARREASPTTNYSRTRRLSRTAHAPQKPLYQAVSAPLPHSGKARAAMCFCIKDGVFIDPCCGSGGMFVQSADFVGHHAGNINNLSVFGQDANPTTRKMALMNLAIRGIEADLGKFNADAFHNDLHSTLKADFILANPPFNLSDWLTVV